MARRLRRLPAGMAAHIVQRGNNRQACFSSGNDFAAYAKWLADAAGIYGLSIHAWVFMTNHIHLLVTPASDQSVSKCMQHVGRCYVRYFNDACSRTGTLFEGRFHSSIVETGEYFLACARYIELNPVRAGMVSNPAEYHWSSYAANALGQAVSMWTPHSDYLALGGNAVARQAAYRALIERELDPKLISCIRIASNKGLVLGSDRFQSKVEELTGQSQRPRKPGPKRKTP